MKKSKAKPGDVFEIQTPIGVAYFQYITRHKEYGDVIYVLPEIYEKLPSDFSEVLKGQGYFTFYPASLAYRRGFVSYVSSYPITLPFPSVLRRRGYFSPDGLIRNWIIKETNGERLTQELTHDERNLPIVKLINHQALISEIIKGYDPYYDV